MNFNNQLRSAMNGISAEKDIAACAKKRASAHSKAVRKSRTVFAVICTAAVMCGTAVSAVKLGWLNDMLGMYGELPEDAFAKISVSTENCTFEPTDSAPEGMDFILIDAVSDGETLIVNYKLEGIAPEDVRQGVFYESADFGETQPWIEVSSRNDILSDGTYGHSFTTNAGINTGDRVGFVFYPMHSDEAIGTAGFTVGEDVPRLVKDIPVGKETTVRDRSKDYISEKTFIVESLTVSALNIKINYLTSDNSNNSVIGRDIKINKKDGQVIELGTLGFAYSASTNLPKNPDGLFMQYISVETGTVIDPNDIESITIGNINVSIDQ